MTRRVMRRLGAAARAGLPAALAAALVVGLAAGCGGDGDGAASATAGTAATAPATREVTVWFSDDQGALRTERRAVPAAADPLAAAMSELAEGPDDPALIPALPTGTRVLSTAVDGDVATVDLSAELESGYPPGGSAAELAVVGPIVRTAAAASGARRVRILADGRAPAPVGAQIDLSQPLAPADLPAP